MAWTDIATRIQKAGQKVFGESVSYTPTGQPAETITGIFDADHLYTELMGDAVVETTKPTLVVRKAAVSQSPSRNDLLTVRATDYRVIEIQPDGQGDLALILETTA